MESLETIKGTWVFSNWVQERDTCLWEFVGVENRFVWDVISNSVFSVPKKERYSLAQGWGCLVSYFTAFWHVRRCFLATAKTGKLYPTCLDVCLIRWWKCMWACTSKWVLIYWWVFFLCSSSCYFFAHIPIPHLLDIPISISLPRSFYFCKTVARYWFRKFSYQFPYFCLSCLTYWEMGPIQRTGYSELILLKSPTRVTAVWWEL